MAKFIYLYRGPATPMSDFTPEQGAERQAAFGAWMEKVGAALVDVGSPSHGAGFRLRRKAPRMTRRYQAGCAAALPRKTACRTRHGWRLRP
jgi:hypothetical protein